MKIMKKKLQLSLFSKKKNYIIISLFRFTEICSNYVTNSDGDLSFSVALNSESIPQNVSKLLFHAIATDFPANDTSKMQQPSNKLNVALTHSNLTSALAVHSVGQSSLKCGPNSIAAYYSAKPGTFWGSIENQGYCPIYNQYLDYIKHIV
jgi:hypothetical protein